MTNSARLDSLIRAGSLYLTVQDAIALAIENNLNLEVERYEPVLADWAVERAQAGGAPRGVPSAAFQVAQADRGLGVLGSELSAGISTSGGASVGGSASGGATISEIGTTAVSQDPVVQNQTNFTHLTTLFLTPLLSGVPSLVGAEHTYTTTFQEGFPSGAYVTLIDYEQFLKENAPTDFLNPAVGPHIDLRGQIYLGRNRGTAVNTRAVRIAKNNTIASREVFQSQLLDLVSSVLGLYWDLVTSNETLKARRQALEIAQKFDQDTKNEIRLGALAGFEVARADAEVASRQKDLGIAQVSVRQQETLLKEQLNRQQDDPELDAAAIVPLDGIQVPDQEDLPPLRELLATAMTARPDMAISKINGENAEINAVGTENGLLPLLVPYGRVWDRGAAGTPQTLFGRTASPYFTGGYGTALEQIFRRDFPNEYAGFYASAPLNNRQAQGDYGVTQLQLKQGDISRERDRNQIVVDISQQAIALRQARARYSAAVETRMLQEQLLQAEQNRFSLGTGSTDAIVIAQRALVNAQTLEVADRSIYAHARLSLDKVLGQTLEVNHVSVDEGLSGRVAK